MQHREVQPGSPAAAVIEEEERLLAAVVARLVAPPAEGAEPGPMMDYDRELVELRDALAEAKPEDVAPLVEQMARMQAIAARRGRSRTLPVDPTSPYFAHMRLREGTRERDVLIGKRGFVERGMAAPIVNWRNAPVSKVYYRYEEGDDYDETDDGHRLEGLVVARRNVSIYGGRLRRIGCPIGTFVRDARGVWHEAEGQIRPTLQGGQGTAARAPRPAPVVKEARGRDARRLGIHSGPIPRADKHLPEIAALIDKEQFDLITAPTSGLVLIQGGAGSGKTTVALHRVAYLNFSDPARFAPKKMLVVVPSVALAQYIAGVLPSLGVRGVAVHTYRNWIAGTRRRVMGRKASREEKVSDDTPDAVVAVKKHPGLLHLVEKVVEDQTREIGAELARSLEGDGAAVMAQWEKLAGRALVPRLRRMVSWLNEAREVPLATRHRAEVVARRLRRRAGDVVRDLAETLTDIGLLRRGFAGSQVKDEALRQVVAWTVRQREVPASEEYEGVDPERLTATDGGSLDDEGSPAGRLDPEDDALLVRLLQLKHGGLFDAKTGDEIVYEHMAIDEAQDLAAVDLKVLLEATHGRPDRCVTVAGDSAQRLVFDNEFHDWRSHLAEAGHDAVEIRPLRLSYRSTAEVMQFARAILGPLADPDEPLVARSGAPVELFRFHELGEAAGFLSEALRSLGGREPTASVAIISRYPEQADIIHGVLARAEVPALRRVRREDFTFTPGVDVTDVTQVKGLEFDYVLAMDVNALSYPDSLEARHLLHIASTRAAHQLWVIVTAEPSPLVPKEMLESTSL